MLTLISHDTIPNYYENETLARILQFDTFQIYIKLSMSNIYFF